MHESGIAVEDRDAARVYSVLPTRKAKGPPPCRSGSLTFPVAAIEPLSIPAHFGRPTATAGGVPTTSAVQIALTI